jgi:hypothetical protein
MAQQTALEWFFDKLKNHEIQAEHFELYQQAKAMEKEQIIEAVKYGDVRGKLETYLTAEQYYSETYEGKNNS